MNRLNNIDIKSVLFEVVMALIFMFCFSHLANAASIDDAEKIVAAEISKETGISEIGLKFTKGQAYLNNIKTDKLELASINIDSEKGIFTGYISANGAQPVLVAGRFFKSVDVPVLSTNLSRTDIIKAENISFLTMEKNKAAELNIITDAKELIGKSPIRGISKNRPISKQQIGGAILVTKQQDINILFKVGNMQIQDIGVALDDGAVGDVIRIRNKTSNKIISGVVQDSKTAIISRGQQKLANL